MRPVGDTCNTDPMTTTIFTTTFIAHRNCKTCADCVESAIATARATGSVGASHETNTGGKIHRASVHRADLMHNHELPEMDIELPVKFVVEFHNEAHTPTLRHSRTLNDEAGVKWYLNEMVNWSEMKAGETVSIRKEVI